MAISSPHGSSAFRGAEEAEEGDQYSHQGKSGGCNRGLSFDGTSGGCIRGLSFDGTTPARARGRQDDRESRCVSERSVLVLVDNLT